MVYSTPSPRLKFYFAGKIAGSDSNHDWNWRESCLDGHMEIACRTDGTWPVLTNAVLGVHVYVGPYFVDNAGGHQSFGENEHGRTEYVSAHGSDDYEERRLPGVVKLCLDAIDLADVVFAWINSADVFGTLVELGYARAHGKKIWVAFDAESVNSEDMWFVAEVADQVLRCNNPHWALCRFLEQDAPNLRTMPYAEYLKTDHWQAVRRGALERANHHCQLCNSTEKLNVHHRTYERRGCEEPGDLTVLCHSCHAKFHDKLIQGRRS